MLQSPSISNTYSDDPLGDELGPLATFAAQTSLILGFLWSFGALYSLFFPISYGMATVLPVLGALFLTPKAVFAKIPISLSALCIFILLAVSVIWSIDRTATTLGIKNYFPSACAIIFSCSILPIEKTKTSLIWLVRISLFITVFALITDPSTRTHAAIGEFAGIPGWHGFFIHKNTMTPFLIFTIVTVLAFHKPNRGKWITLGVIATLIIGSTSATALSVSILTVIGWVWIKLYQNQEDLRSSTVFVSISIVGLILAVLGLVSSMATITGAYGKDLTFSGRTDIWGASLEAIENKPFFGHGYKSLFYFENISPETAEFWRSVGFRASHAHNGALDLALHIGLIGLVVFFAIWITTFRRAMLTLSSNQALASWVLCTLAAQMFISLSENVYLGGWLNLLILFKIILLKYRNAERTERYSTP